MHKILRGESDGAVKAWLPTARDNMTETILRGVIVAVAV